MKRAKSKKLLIVYANVDLQIRRQFVNMNEKKK